MNRTSVLTNIFLTSLVHIHSIVIVAFTLDEVCTQVGILIVWSLNVQYSNMFRT